jgi:DNA polymerase-1
MPKKILEFRRLSKLKSTYTDKLPQLLNAVDARIHTTFGQATAVTGRLASSEPNLQNIPVRTEEGRRVREAFVAPKGCRIVSADYSQIELRIMAHISGDEGLLKAFALGHDVHRATAAEVFGVELDAVTSDQRRMAKVINFGLIYGMSAWGLRQNLGVEKNVAEHYIAQYFARYPAVARYMETTKRLARQNGYVQTAFGRRLWLPDIMSTRVPVRNAAERAAINAPMQGTAADLIKKAMIDVRDWLIANAKRSRLVLQVHDELILEVPEDEVDEICREVPRLMAQVADLKVPLIAEVGVADNWEAAH